MESYKKIIITGAAGFLGGRVAKHFAKLFPGSLIIATSRRNKRAQEFEESGIKFIAGDLTESGFADTLTSDSSLIIHCAALSSPWGNYSDFYQSNFLATKSLADAAVRNRVPAFIFISTPSIYFNFRDRYNVKESDGLPVKMVNHYAATKLLAEEYVLGLNGQNIQTLALRPRAIIGAEDTVILPRVLEAYSQGKLKIVGNGKNICDLTAVRNVIEAIVCAINADKSAYGKAYNITDGDPVVLWEALNYMLRQLELEPVTKKVPARLAESVAFLSELKAKLISANKEPALTRYGIGVMAQNFTLDISSARKNLNYKPVQTTMEAIDEYIAWHNNRK